MYCNVSGGVPEVHISVGGVPKVGGVPANEKIRVCIMYYKMNIHSK